MNWKEFQNLENKIKNQNFNSNYKNINRVMFFLSIFGHVSSIFLAYFFLAKVLSGIVSNEIVVFIASIIMLGGLELLKRDIFDKFSIEQLKFKNIFSKNVVSLTLVSLAIVGLSFTASIKGAKEFSDKTKVIETAKKEELNTYKDSLEKVYNTKISDIENETKLLKDKYDSKDKEQTEIESNQPLSRQQKSRVKDLKSEKVSIKNDLTINEVKIKSLKDELGSKVSEYDKSISSETSQVKDENDKNSVLFVIISTLIELTILFGVYFNQYYRWRSYNDYKSKITNDDNYQKWSILNSILETIYLKDAKINDKLMSSKSIMEFCRINGVNVIKKDVDECIKVLMSLKVLKGTSTKYINKERDIAIELLRSHFNIN